MKIIIKKGRQFEGDKLFCIKTNDEEAFNLYRWMLLANQLALNESNKYNEALKKGNPLYFEEATKKAMKLGRQGIDLMDSASWQDLKELCEDWMLDFEKFNQTRLREFENEST